MPNHLSGPLLNLLRCVNTFLYWGAQNQYQVKGTNYFPSSTGYAYVDTAKHTVNLCHCRLCCSCVGLMCSITSTMMPGPFQQACSLAREAPPWTVRGSYSSLMHNSAFVLDKFHTVPLQSAPSSSITLSEWQSCPPAFRADLVISSKVTIRLFKHDLSLVNPCSLFRITAPSSSVHLFYVNCLY